MYGRTLEVLEMLSFQRGLTLPVVVTDRWRGVTNMQLNIKYKAKPFKRRLVQTTYKRTIAGVLPSAQEKARTYSTWPNTGSARSKTK
jgi:hypothetical protein